MNPKLKKVRDSFIESVGQLSASLGLSRVAGQLYALLYLNNGPPSLDDMVRILKISKGNVSVNIRELERWGAVRKVWVKGSRKDHYEAELDVLKVASNRLKEGLKRRMDDAIGTVNKTTEFINDGNEKLSPADKKIAKIYRERLNNVKELHNLVKGFLKNISRIL